ncbi:hypothetical protein D0Y65_009790 [Glycine soja]|uniref:Uncharacterized protein n=1 Tax=Glycine soja TaxID=3848 RepID=A0A445L0H9_GLYSO|nr:hypothetical protein D0Y65_009790 [Glycine soja]
MTYLSSLEVASLSVNNHVSNVPPRKIHVTSPLRNRVPLPLWCNITLAEVAAKRLKQRTQQRLLLPFLCIDVNNDDICFNEAHKARLGGALGADPQAYVLVFMLLLVCADLVHGAKDKQLRVKEPVRTHLICNPSRPLVTHLICNPSIMQVAYCHTLISSGDLCLMTCDLSLVLVSWVASGGSNPARLGELGGNLLPLFPIKRLKGAVLRIPEPPGYVFQLFWVKKIVSVKKIQAEVLPSCALALWAYVALVWELDDIMLKMESSDNFCSSINGDHEDDVIEVYDDDDDDDVDHNRVGDSDDLDNVGLEHEEEVDSEFDMGKMTVEDVSRLDFCDLEIAYLFYCWYAKIIGFSVRKSHILRNTCRETLQQTFVCSCVGYRRDKGSTSNTRKRREKKKQLLEQFLEAMKGKTPCSIIIDGNLAMRNVITRAIPSVFHKLCAWHLLRNALSHVRDKQVLKWLKKLIDEDMTKSKGKDPLEGLRGLMTRARARKAKEALQQVLSILFEYKPKFQG